MVANNLITFIDDFFAPNDSHYLERGYRAIRYMVMVRASYFYPSQH